MKKLLILSGKGGTGKTTVSAALIRLSGARAIADCDVDAPNLHLIAQQSGAPETHDFMGGEKASVDPKKCIGCGCCVRSCRFNAIRISDGKARVNEYTCEGCGVCVHVCPAEAASLLPDLAGQRALYRGETVFSTATLKMGRGNSGKLVTDVKMSMLRAAPECALAVLDGSPGIGCPVIASVSGMDLVLVVAEPSGSGVSDLERLCKTAATLQAKLAVCVNKADVSPEHTVAIERFCAAQGLPFVGRIPYDPEAVKAVNEGRTVVDSDCPAGRAIRHIYTELQRLLHDDADACNSNPC
ncbi:MAG: 4Fe-4S binding protein [Oscillospiraceae bacterium]|nr:4Fe-4S binding protein [Oscillospiraceae bacterium]